MTGRNIDEHIVEFHVLLLENVTRLGDDSFLKITNSLRFRGVKIESFLNSIVFNNTKEFSKLCFEKIDQFSLFIFSTAFLELVSKSNLMKQ